MCSAGLISRPFRSPPAIRATSRFLRHRSLQGRQAGRGRASISEGGVSARLCLPGAVRLDGRELGIPRRSLGLRARASALAAIGLGPGSDGARGRRRSDWTVLRTAISGSGFAGRLLRRAHVEAGAAKAPRCRLYALRARFSPRACQIIQPGPAMRICVIGDP